MGSRSPTREVAPATLRDKQIFRTWRKQFQNSPCRIFPAPLALASTRWRVQISHFGAVPSPARAQPSTQPDPAAAYRGERSAVNPRAGHTQAFAQCAGVPCAGSHQGARWSLQQTRSDPARSAATAWSSSSRGPNRSCPSATPYATWSGCRLRTRITAWRRFAHVGVTNFLMACG
jgi:hypothetical protein